MTICWRCSLRSRCADPDSWAGGLHGVTSVRECGAVDDTLARWMSATTRTRTSLIRDGQARVTACRSGSQRVLSDRTAARGAALSDSCSFSSGILVSVGRFRNARKPVWPPREVRGRNGGRPRVTAGEPKVVLAKKLHADKTLESDDICQTLRISRSTFYRYVRLTVCHFAVVLRCVRKTHE